MFIGTEANDFFPATSVSTSSWQGVFPESAVRGGYRLYLIFRKFHSNYVWARKGLKGCIKLETSDLVFFCRAIPLWLWVGSLLAVAWGGMLCQLGND